LASFAYAFFLSYNNQRQNSSENRFAFSYFFSTIQLRDYFQNEIPEMPVYSFDTSLLTASGYRGMEPYEICAPFFRINMYDAVGICILDEFDKKLIPSFNSHGYDTNAETQANMLTIVEGCELNHRDGRVVNTSDIMFIGLGSFDNFRRARECDNHIIGFNNNDSMNSEHYAPVDRNAMIESGGTYELIGRFPVIVNYEKLSSTYIRQIIDNTVKILKQDFDCDIIVTENMVQYLLSVANGKFGCRIFNGVLRTAVLTAYAEAMQSQQQDRILVITIDSVIDIKFLWREYSEEEKAEIEHYRSLMKRLQSMLDEKNDTEIKNDKQDLLWED